jgi:flagellin-specific chaperone FliS
MHGYRAYYQQKQASPTRIDLILTLYRTAIDSLDRAEALLREQKIDAARPLLTKTQWIVSAMGAGLLDDIDETANNFRKLYEFVSFKLTQGSAEDIVAARRVLATLLEAFNSVRGQAMILEAEGKIPTLDEAHQICLST